ncbi:hypothetical protein AKO1_015592 [Acrasis kona]|uniref:BAR domain-containing protein n=1 Tax=Acrasis kona TaxID=1008807 RepID=A0AAW2ZF60_9EUKA
MDKFKSAMNRTAQTINEKLGKSETTVDENYDNLFRIFTSSESVASNFSKHSSNLIDNFNTMTSLLCFVAEDLTELYKNDEDPRKRNLAEEITTISNEIEELGVKRFQTQLLTHVVNPTNEYLEKFKEVKKLCSKRNDTLKEYDYFRNRVMKLSETPGGNKDPLKLPKEKEKLNTAKGDYELTQQVAMERMQELVDMKTIVFNDVTEQTIGNLIQYSDQVKASLDKMSKFAAKPLEGNVPSVVSPKSTTSPISPPSASARKPPATSNPLPPSFNCEWYYLDENVNQLGPVTFPQLKQKYKQGSLNPKTHVFGADMADWATIDSVPQLVSHLSSS